MKHLSGLWKISVPVIAVVLAVVQIVLVNQSAGTGKTVRTVDITVDTLRKENELLEQRVASASSLATISVKARDMGFVEPDKTQFLTLGASQLPVAFNNPR